MISKRTLPALLLIAVLPTLACQLLRPARARCRVRMPDRGWVEYWHGDEIAFSVDGIDWKAAVDCEAGQLVEGDPVHPARAREILIQVEDTSYRLITSNPDAAMAEYRENGSHIRIETGYGYYVAVLSASPANFDHAMVRYFMGGQTAQGVTHVHCYNHTGDLPHTALVSVGLLWTLSKPATVSLLCSGTDFILEMTTQVTPEMLELGPTPVPALPVQPVTPTPPGLESGLRQAT